MNLAHRTLGHTLLVQRECTYTPAAANTHFRPIL